MNVNLLFVYKKSLHGAFKAGGYTVHTSSYADVETSAHEIQCTLHIYYSKVLLLSLISLSA